VGLVFWWGAQAGVGGAVLGFACGHLMIVVALLTLCFLEFPPEWIGSQEAARVGRYAKKYVLLILSGFFFYLGQWIDKVVFWLSRGIGVEGSFFRLFDSYDFPVYLAGLTIIPGLVYFVVFSETAFYFSLIKFLNCLISEPYSVILQAKFNLLRTMNHELRDQTLFQAVASGAALLAALWFLPGPHLIVVVAMAGAFFQLLLMTLLNFLYYFEFFSLAFVGAGVFLGCQILFSWAGVVWPSLAPGVGFLASAAAACAVSYGLLVSAGKTLDRRIFLKAVG